MSKAFRCFLAVSLLFFLAACSVVMATRQPDKKDLSVLQNGTERSRVIAELGPPQYTEEKEGRKVDVFSFVQGYGKGMKAGRALAHGAADVFTLGLWELAGTPIESAASGTQVKVKVTYDQDNRVASTEAFAGGQKLDKAGVK